MSKSYDNTIEIFGDAKEIKKKVMSIVSDSKGLDDPKEPEKCNIFALYKLFASEAQAEEMALKYRTGGYGYGHAKKELLEIMSSYFEPFRKRREELMRDMAGVEKILRDGAEKARAVAEKTMAEVRKAVGLA